MIVNRYFVHVDANAGERNSHGVFFMRDPRSNDGIVFYCSEFSIIWARFEDVPDPNKCFGLHDFKRRERRLEPATWEEIESAGLRAAVDYVLEEGFRPGLRSNKIEIGEFLESNRLQK